MYYLFLLSNHSQDGLVSCGGVDTPLSCATFTGGSWRASHTLLQVGTFPIFYLFASSISTYQQNLHRLTNI